MRRLYKSFAAGLVCLPYLLAMSLPVAADVELEVMDPRGEVPPPPFNAPSGRVSNLDGKTVGIYWIGKAGGNNFWDGVETLLNEKYPNTKTVRYQGPFDLGDERANQIAREVDTVLYGVGD